VSSNTRKGWRRIGWPGRAAVAALALLPVWITFLIVSGPKVSVHRVERRPLVQRVVANGRVYVPVRAQLGTMIGGVVADVLVDEGSKVHTGDLLLQLDDSEAKAGVAQAAARVEQLREVERRTTAESLRQAEVTLQHAEADLARAQALFDSQAVAQQNLDQVRRERDLARSRRESAQAQLRSTEAGGSQERLALAELEQAQARLAQMRVIARVNGTILKRQAQPGDVIQPGQILLIMARDGDTELVVEPEERSLALLEVGQRALASTDAFPGRRFAARISRIAPSVDPERGTVEVRLLVPDPPAYLRPDMTVSVDIETERRQDALVLPAEDVRETESARPWVLLVRAGRVERREIEVGLRGEGTIEITDGLAEGDHVVAGAVARVRPGRRVRGVLLAPPASAPAAVSS
jgi:HlyD family secretion protein